LLPNPTHNIANINLEVLSIAWNPPLGNKCARPRYGKTIGVAKIPKNKGILLSKTCLEIGLNENGETKPEHPTASPSVKYLPSIAVAKINPPAAADSYIQNNNQNNKNNDNTGTTGSNFAM
jgi:hypothetical protein